MTHKRISEHSHRTRQHTTERTRAGPVNYTRFDRTCAHPGYLDKYAKNEPKMSVSVHGTSAHGPKQGPERAIDTHDTRSKNSAHGSFLAAKRCPRGGAGRQTLAHDDVRLRYLRGGRGGGVRGGGATSSTWPTAARRGRTSPTGGSRRRRLPR